MPSLSPDYSPNSILDLSDDWGEDVNDTEGVAAQGHGRPFSGSAVQDFLKLMLRDIPAEAVNEGDAFRFYNKSGELVFELPLTSDVYYLTISSDMPTYVLDSVTTANVEFSYHSQKGTIGSQERQDFDEGTVSYVLQCDSGGGYRVVAEGIIQGTHVGSVTINIKPFLSSGSNLFRMTMIGGNSKKQSTESYRVTLTSMYLRSAFQYYNIWMESLGSYRVNGLYFYAPFAKVLNIAIKNDELVYTDSTAIPYTSSQNYQTSPLAVDITRYFTPPASGVYTISIWLTGSNQSTNVYTYDIIYVKTEDEGRIGLIAVNEVAPIVKNYGETDAFVISSYGISQCTIEQSFKSADVNVDLPTQYLEVTSGSPTHYRLDLAVESESLAAEYIANVRATTNSREVKIAVDMSDSSLPYGGYDFYLSPASQSNSDVNRDKLYNKRDGSYNRCAIKNVSYCNDMWTTKHNRSCLLIRANEYLDTKIQLFGGHVSDGVTFEMCCSLEDISDASQIIAQCLGVTYIILYSGHCYEWDIETNRYVDIGEYSLSTEVPEQEQAVPYVVVGNKVYKWDTEYYQYGTARNMDSVPSEKQVSTDTYGLKITGNTLQVMCEASTSFVEQSFTLREGEIFHICVVVSPNYNGTPYNLCQIYYNGIPICNFQYATGVSFGDGTLVLCPVAADIAIYTLRTYHSALGAEAVYTNYVNCAE